jgi:hypothetical protein
MGFFCMRKTHENITAGLTKMINDLDDLAEANAAKVIMKQAEIERITNEIVEINNEYDKCERTAKRLREIIG